jgi:hypothetical protein
MQCVGFGDCLMAITFYFYETNEKRECNKNDWYSIVVD